MEIVELIEHPERMDRDTLYELRSVLALYPYFQTARLLMLQNLYLLHDPSFDQELRRAAIYITDRKVLFQMIEAAHYKLKAESSSEAQHQVNKTQRPTAEERDSRTITLIDDFLDSLPKEEEEDTTQKKGKRKPTPADAAVDYVAYLLESESDEEREKAAEVPQLIGHSLIDSFINNDKGKITLNETPTLKPELDDTTPDTQKGVQQGYFTETFFFGLSKLNC